MDLSKLKEPFPAEDIEWRLQSCGNGKNGIYAICLAYVTNRAICNRLDDVVGPENWKNEFKEGPDGGVLCGLSIKVNDTWVTKWDGAENTNIEAVKGGLSGAMKRSASTGWGIGRYLYYLDEGFAKVFPENSDEKGFFGKTKEGQKFKWQPPTLPAWALPGGDGKPPRKNSKPSNNNNNNEPSSELVRETTILESWIEEGVLTGDGLKKAKYYIEKGDLEGIKRTNEWCKSQRQSA